MVIDKRDILATSVRNVEELKRRYDLDKETKSIDLSDYIKNDILPISIANGGTGANNRARAVYSLRACDMAGGTRIAENADLNSAEYTVCGNYYEGNDSRVQTLLNCPTIRGFRMEVKSIGLSIDSLGVGTWKYYIRELTNWHGYSWIQRIYVAGTTGSIFYGAWQQILTTANGALKPKLLWSNASPTSSFAAQTINVALSAYDLIMILWRNGTGNLSFLPSVIFPYSDGAAFSTATYHNENMKRDGTVTASSISFGEGYYDGSVNNARVIPYSIYGISI